MKAKKENNNNRLSLSSVFSLKEYISPFPLSLSNSVFFFFQNSQNMNKISLPFTGGSPMSSTRRLVAQVFFGTLSLLIVAALPSYLTMIVFAACRGFVLSVDLGELWFWKLFSKYYVLFLLLLLLL